MLNIEAKRNFSNIFFRRNLMRQKKSNWIYYVVAALVVAAIAFVVVHEVPMEVETVETVLN